MMKLTVYAETYVKSVVPTVLSDMMYHCLGSEKLVDILDQTMKEMADVGVCGLISGFVLLELDTSRGLERLAGLAADDRADMWVVDAITQRLYSYDTSRPLPTSLRGKSESLLADLEMKAKGIARNTRRGIKGQVLEQVKKKAFKEEVEAEKPK